MGEIAHLDGQRQGAVSCWLDAVPPLSGAKTGIAPSDPRQGIAGTKQAGERRLDSRPFLRRQPGSVSIASMPVLSADDGHTAFSNEHRLTRQ